MLVTKGRIGLDRDTLEWLESALGKPRVELIPLTPSIAVQATQLGSTFPSDPADRIIAATAIVESATLVTKDSKIRKYLAVTTVW